MRSAAAASSVALPPLPRHAADVRDGDAVLSEGECHGVVLRSAAIRAARRSGIWPRDRRRARHKAPRSGSAPVRMAWGTQDGVVDRECRLGARSWFRGPAVQWGGRAGERQVELFGLVRMGRIVRTRPEHQDAAGRPSRSARARAARSTRSSRSDRGKRRRNLPPCSSAARPARRHAPTSAATSDAVEGTDACRAAANQDRTGRVDGATGRVVPRSGQPARKGLAASIPSRRARAAAMTAGAAAALRFISGQSASSIRIHYASTVVAGSGA